MSRLSLERNITADLGRLKTISVAVIARHKALDGRAAELMPLYEQASADAYIVPGDPTTHKRLLGLAATTAAIALIMLGTGSVPKAGSPTAKIVGPVPTTNEPSSISAPNQPPPALSKDATANPLQILPAVVPAGTAQRTVPIPAPAIAKTDLEKLVVRQTANVRDAPNGSTVLRTVTQGMVVRVFARRDGWVQIGDDAPWGWVSSKLLAEIP